MSPIADPEPHLESPDSNHNGESSLANHYNEDRLSVVLKAAEVATWEWDVPGNTMLWDPIMHALFGLELGGFGGRYEDFLALLHPGDRDRLAQGANFSSRKGPWRDNEFRVVTPKGEVRTLQTRSRVLCGPDGKPSRILGVAWDVTYRRSSDEASARDRELLAALMNHTSDCIYFKDRQSKFTAVNRATSNRFGKKDPSEMLGKTDMDVFPADHAHASTAMENERQIIETGEPIVDLEEMETWSDGRVSWVSTTKMPLLDPRGRIIGTFGVSRDITSRKRAEVELERVAAELEEARDAALDSARIKSEFLANMSHEIRTPMNGVIGMVGLLLDTELSEEQRDFADTIRFSANALLTIINDILDFSKMEAGKLKFEQIDFDLRVVVEEAVGLLAENALSKRLELASLVRSEVPTALQGDPTRLRQVLTNLISNAIKFTECGEVVVRASMTQESATHVCIRFSVTDTGIGIEQEAQKRLFQAFSQADGSTTRKYGGTGLGLAICKQLVRQMNGEVGLESELGTGSTFWFTAQFEKQMSASKPGEQRTGNLQGIHTLIVDDNATNRKILHHQLTQWGMVKEEASGGIDALVALHRGAREGRPFQLAILDMHMAGMDGWMLAKAIKADPQIAGTRLVMMTSLDRQQDEAAMHAAGLDAYLTKPVKHTQLFECLSEVMKDAPGIAPAHEENSKRKPAAAAAPPNSLRVLIAEDNIVNQKVAVSQIRKLGCQAEVVSNGYEALKALEAADYDLVLMDCQMPVLDGYEATAQLRMREGQRRHTVVVAMTAHAIEGDREKCLAAGMDDYLSKPVQIDELREVVTGLQPAGG
jgi:PAS domain S-box-containing protein